MTSVVQSRTSFSHWRSHSPRPTDSPQIAESTGATSDTVAVRHKSRRQNITRPLGPITKFHISWVSTHNSLLNLYNRISWIDKPGLKCQKLAQNQPRTLLPTPIHLLFWGSVTPVVVVSSFMLDHKMCIAQFFLVFKDGRLNCLDIQMITAITCQQVLELL